MTGRVIRALKANWLTVVIFAVLSLVRIVAIYNHDELIADETYSLMLATHNPAYITKLPADTVMTGREIHATLIANHPLSDDLAALYINNSDIPHASLYYMALRLCVGGMTEYNASDLARRGGWLNMLFFAVTFVAVWHLLLLIFNKCRHRKALIAVGLVAAFAGSSAVECTELIREYQMAQMMVALCCWVTAAIALRIRHAQRIDFKLWLGLAGATAGALSTGYLNALIVTMLYGWIVIAALTTHRPTDAYRCVAAGVASLVLCPAMYLGFFNFLLHSTIHTEYAFRSYADVPAIVFGDCICRGMLTLPGLLLVAVLAVVALCGARRRCLIDPRLMPWMPLMALAAMLLTEYASVLQALRYVFPLIPIMALFVPLILNALPGKWLTPAACCLLGVWLLGVAVAKPVHPTYQWHEIAEELKDGATLYHLNANELPQVAPMVNPAATYHLTDSCPADLTRPIVSRVRPSIDSLPAPKKLTGPLRIYRFK